MASNTIPVFTTAPRQAAVAITTAETSLTAPANVGTVFTAGSNGSLVERVVIKARGNTTAGIVRLFLYDGASYFLLAEILTETITASSTVAAWAYVWVDSSGALALPSGWSLRATTDNGDDFSILAQGGDF